MDARKAYAETLNNIREKIIGEINKSIINGECSTSVYLPHWIDSSNIDIIKDLLIESSYTGFIVVYNSYSNYALISWQFDKLSKENDLTKVV